MNGKLTYIFGHKNPDTDSICGAISLSYLKNKLGMNTIPSALGNLNSETKYALELNFTSSVIFFRSILNLY